VIIDDDPDVRQIMCSILADIGYNIREAATGAAGLRILQDRRPDLLVLDFGMPGENGAAVAAAARRLYESLRILFVSGYSYTPAIERIAGKTGLLRKPFRPSELAAAVRSALDAPALQGSDA
jgi:CheY-like chemotaxis protein